MDGRDGDNRMRSTIYKKKVPFLNYHIDPTYSLKKGCEPDSRGEKNSKESCERGSSEGKGSHREVTSAPPSGFTRLINYNYPAV